MRSVPAVPIHNPGELYRLIVGQEPPLTYDPDTLPAMITQVMRHATPPTISDALRIDSDGRNCVFIRCCVDLPNGTARPMETLNFPFTATDFDSAVRRVANVTRILQEVEIQNGNDLYRAVLNQEPPADPANRDGQLNREMYKRSRTGVQIINSETATTVQGFAENREDIADPPREVLQFPYSIQQYREAVARVDDATEQLIQEVPEHAKD